MKTKKLYAKVTTPFKGRPDDEPTSRDFVEGEVVSGDLAKVAIEQKWAEATDGPADEAPDEPAKSPLDGLSAAKLKAYAKKHGIALDAKLTARDHIRAAIDAARPPKS